MSELIINPARDAAINKSNNDNSKIRALYVRYLRPHFSTAISRQRLKLVWFVWGYWPLLILKTIPLFSRLRLLYRFLRVDWNVPLCHSPRDMVHICEALCERPAASGEIMVEAGCWQGGSSCKFSIICKMLGLQLHIYDSFEGVASQQVLPDADHQTRHDSTRFTGTYASPESVLRNNLARHGEPTVSTIHKGWFAETIGKDQAAGPVRAVYIDCDIVKGTEEVLMGSLPSLVRDGVVFSQDFMIISVRKMLTDPATWTGLNSSTPTIKRLSWALARLDF